MNKEFFSSFDERKNDFATRNAITGDVHAELMLSTGRVFVVNRVIEATSDWVSIEGHDIDDLTSTGLVLPYYQITHISLMKSKPQRMAGFTP